MYQVLITVAERPSPGYLLAVVIVGPDGKRGQECLVRSVREGRIYGNGVCAGARHATSVYLPGGGPDHLMWPVNPTVDPILRED